MWQELPPHTRDWSEDDWERYFDEQDRLWYEYGADTALDLPSAPWTDTTPDIPYFAAEDDSPSVDADFASFFEPDDVESETDAEDDDADDEDMLSAGWQKAIDEDLPAWCAAVDFGQFVYEFVEPDCQSEVTGPRQYILNTLLSESLLVQDYIVSGHHFGYTEDTLCGNITLCRRALASLDRCIQCLERLDPADDVKRRALSIRGRIVRAFLLRRIETLREMIWWR